MAQVVNRTGRAWVKDVVKALIEVSPPNAEPVRPILVIHGCGGSGRTHLLEEIRRDWADQAPLALVAPGRLPEPTDAVPRPFLSTVLLELGAPVGDYAAINFSRVVLAHIALAEPLTSEDPIAEMKNRISARARAFGVELLRPMLTEGVRAAPAAWPETQPLAEPVAKVVDVAAENLVDGIKRSSWLRRRTFEPALTWYAVQDPRQGFDEYHVLVRLNHQAWSGGPANDIDDLLVRALLADLTDGMRSTPHRKANVVLLVDDADGPEAVKFLTAVLRVRERAEAADPLTIVATSGGSVLHDLGHVVPGRSLTSTATAAGALVPVPAPWTSAPLPALTRKETWDRVGIAWPAELGIERIVNTVHRVAGGHPAATDAVLNRLQRADAAEIVALVEEPRLLLTEPAMQGWLQQMVRGLPSTDPDGLESLTTLAAARDSDEAELLLRAGLGENPLLGPAAGRLLDVSSMWAPTDGLDRPAPAALLRYLLLRRLAQRPEGWSSGWPDWVVVHTALAQRPVDEAGGLHHLLALERGADVEAGMDALLESVDGAAWLALLDVVSATPSRVALGGPGGDAPADEFGIVGRRQLLADPCLTRMEQVRHLFALAEDYQAIYARARSGQREFIARADRARSRAAALL